MGSMLGFVPRKKVPSSGFGRRLMQLRRARGLTQVLAAAVDGTQRVIGHCEIVGSYAGVQALVALARVLHATDEVLELEPPARLPAGKLSRQNAALLRQLHLASQLSERDKPADLRPIDDGALAEMTRRSA